MAKVPELMMSQDVTESGQHQSSGTTQVQRNYSHWLVVHLMHSINHLSWKRQPRITAVDIHENCRTAIQLFDREEAETRTGWLAYLQSPWRLYR